MARFRAEIRGQRGEASRLGSAKTGIVREVNGLDLGIEVQGGTTTGGESDCDTFDVWITGGSNGRYKSMLAFTVKREPTGDWR